METKTSKKIIDFSDIDIEEISSENVLSDTEFIDFLRSHNVYDEFIFNVKLDMESEKCFFGKQWFGIDTFCVDINKTNGRHNYVNLAFNWGLTNEGHNFWESVDRLWKKKLTSVGWL